MRGKIQRSRNFNNDSWALCFYPGELGERFFIVALRLAGGKWEFARRIVIVGRIILEEIVSKPSFDGGTEDVEF